MDNKKPSNTSERCDTCGWPYAEDRDDGCVPDDCSMRPAPQIRFSNLGKPIETINVRKYEAMRAACDAYEKALIDYAEAAAQYEDAPSRMVTFSRASDALMVLRAIGNRLRTEKEEP